MQHQPTGYSHHGTVQLEFTYLLDKALVRSGSLPYRRAQYHRNKRQNHADAGQVSSAARHRSPQAPFCPPIARPMIRNKERTHLPGSRPRRAGARWSRLKEVVTTRVDRAAARLTLMKACSCPSCWQATIASSHERMCLRGSCSVMTRLFGQ